MMKMANTGESSGQRLKNLDYLRGLCATGIMFYHYYFWSYGGCNSETFLGKVSIYGVCTFYVLSGLTLYHVYYKKFSIDWASVRDFFIKRFFRIYPLLWLSTIGTLIFRRTILDWKVWVWNFTGLFGIYRLDSYIGTGVWSIGNELVFYLFFPLFVIMAKKWRNGFYLLGALILAIYIYYGFVMVQGSSLADKWKQYINPFNQLFLFYGGVAIGLLFEKRTIRNPLLAVLMTFSFLAFFFYPVNGDEINLVHGITRLVYTFICFSFCFSFYKVDFMMPRFLEIVFSKLGEITYSVYLLHPIVWSIVEKTINFRSPLLKILFCILLTILISLFVYQKFEKYFVALGRRVTQRRLPGYAIAESIRN